MKLPYESIHRSPNNTDPIKPVESIKNNEFSEESLGQLTAITDDIAKKIASLDFDNINLDSLNDLSEDAAKYLVKHVGTTPWNKRGRAFMSLNGLKSLDDNLAEILSTYNGALSLSGVAHISDEAVKHLAKIKHNLVLNGLREISVKAAEYLSEHKGYWEDAAPLYLDGLNEISDEVAKHLGNHKGYLSLNGLTAISDNSAESLAHVTGYLSLNGLKKISDMVAEQLSKQKGTLSLNGLEVISENAARSLDAHGGGSLLLDNLEINYSEEELLRFFPNHFKDLEKYLEFVKRGKTMAEIAQEMRSKLKITNSSIENDLANLEKQPSPIEKREERLKQLRARYGK